MIKIIDNNFSLEKFNQLATHPLQSWEWGEARKKMGIEVLRLGEFKKDQLVNIFQLTFHKIPLTNLKIGYLPRSVYPSEEILEFLFDYAKKNHTIFIKFEPYVENYKFKIKNLELIKNSKFKIINSSHPLFPEWTMILDLKKSEEELLKEMKSKTRYNIRLAEKKGVTVKEMSDNKGFEIFSKLYFDTCKKQQYFGHTKKYHQIIWETLKNSQAHILVAFFKNTPLAAYELFYFNNIFYYPYGGTALEYRNLMGSNLLMWEVIKLGKKLGADTFDMWGSLGPNYDPNDPWAGFTRFKEGYNAKFTQMISSHDLVINSFQYKIYNLLDKLRSLYLNLRKKLSTI